MALAAIRAQREHQEKERKRQLEERKERVQQIFQSNDRNKDGKLTKPEVSNALSEMFDCSPSAEEIDYLFRTSGNGLPLENVTFGEFRTMLQTYKMYVDDFRDPKGEYAQLFEELDTDRSGGLNPDQLRKLLEKYSGQGKVTDEDVQFVMSSADVTKSGEVRKIELRIALAAWFQRMCQQSAQAGQPVQAWGDPSGPPKRSSKLCAVM